MLLCGDLIVYLQPGAPLSVIHPFDWTFGSHLGLLGWWDLFISAFIRHVGIPRLVEIFDFDLPFRLTRLVVHVDLTFGHARLI